MKNFKKNTIILLIISTLFIFFLVKNNFIETVRIIRNANMFWIIIAFIIFYLYVFLESITMYLIVIEYKKDYKFKETLKLMIMTKFFNGVTPFSSGGQPLQIYELKKDGIETSKGTAIIVESFLIFQFALILFGIIAVILNSIFHFFIFTPTIFYFTIIGFILNILAFLIVFIISINEKINKSLNKFILKIIDKLKLKNKERKIIKVNNYFEEYYEGFEFLRQNKFLMIKGIVLEILAITLLFIIPIFIFKALHVEYNISLLGITTMSAYIFIVGSFIPIPGGTGGTEYAFLEFFKPFISFSSLTPTLIVWRFVTYYAPVVIGGVVFNFLKKRENKN